MPAKKEVPVEEPTKESVEALPTVSIGVPHHREAPVSINIKLYSPGGADCMLTVRSGATEEEVKSVIDVFAFGAQYAKESYKLHFAPEYPQAASVPSSTSVPPHTATTSAVPQEFPPTSVPSAPPVQGNAPGITSLSFQAEKLVSETKEGTRYWKVVGPPFMKYGVRVWDEVLTEAGFALDLMNDPVYSIPGYTAHYVEREPGKPQKVVKLVEN